MTNITNYDYHVQKMGGGTGSTLPGMFQFSQLNSSSIQSRLKAAGIDTGSKQYKAVIRQMAKDGCTGSMFTCVQAIKNLMKNYNARGEWVEPTTGLTGLLVTDETGDSYKRMIDIPESSKEKMFEYVKNNYIEKMVWRTEQEKRKFIWICINKWTRMIGCRQAGHWASIVRRIRKRLYLRLRKLIRHGHMVKPYLRVSWRISQGSLWKII